MNEVICAFCGAELPHGAPEGLCPKCLLDFGARELGRQEATAGDLSLPGGRSTAVEGSRPFGSYELLEEVGRGGMGIVYRAVHKPLQRIVALKLLPFGRSNSPAMAERFRAEAAAAASLQHPNIVAIHDIGDEEGQQFFSMDYVEGQTMADVVRDQPLTPRKAAAYLKAIAEAVQYAHQHGIVHRDLKPSNILIDLADQPRITDFGLAKRVGDTTMAQPGSPELTLSGQVLGSPNFMSPEQAAGARTVGRATDIYSLGALLYHVLTRQPPFQADTLTGLLRQVLEAEPVRPRALNSGIPRDLETICLKCLEKEPGRRYRNAGDLAADLQAFLEQRPIQARPVGLAIKGWKWSKRRPALALLSLALAASFVLGLSGILWQWNRARNTAAAETVQRKRAEAGEYAADMHLAQLALEGNNRSVAAALVDKYRPGTGEVLPRPPRSANDLRGWEWRYLWGLCRANEATTLHRFQGRATAVAFSPRLKLLAASSYQETELWDLATGKAKALGPLAPWKTGVARALAFSPAEDLLAVGTWDEKGRPTTALWELKGESRSKRHDLPIGNFALSFSPDGKLIAALHQAGKVSLAECDSGRIVQEIEVLPLRDLAAGMVVFSPLGRQLAVGVEYGWLRLFDLESNTNAVLNSPYGASVYSGAFSSDGAVLATGSGMTEGIISLWDTRTGELIRQITNHADAVTGLAFSADGRNLISSSADGTIRTTGLADLRELRCLHTRSEGIVSMSVLDHGTNVATADASGAVERWDMERPGRVSYTNILVSSSWRSMRHVPPAGFKAAIPDWRVVRRFGIAFKPDSRHFIMPRPDGSLATYDARSFECVDDLGLGSNHWAVALSPDGRWLATGDEGGDVTVRDYSSLRLVAQLHFPFEWCGLLRFSSSGNYLLTAVMSNDHAHQLKILRTRDWKEVALSSPEIHEPWAVDISPDDKFIVVGGGHVDGTVKLFRWESLEYVGMLLPRSTTIATVLFSPGGDDIGVVALDGIFRLLNLSSRQWVELPGHRDLTMGGCFLPEPGRFSTGGQFSADALKVWDLRARREVLTLTGDGLVFMLVTCSPDGNTLAAQSFYGVAHFWHAPSWQEIEEAEQHQR